MHLDSQLSVLVSPTGIQDIVHILHKAVSLPGGNAFDLCHHYDRHILPNQA